MSGVSALQVVRSPVPGRFALAQAFRSGRGPASRGDKPELTPSTWCVQEFRSRTTTPCSHRHFWNAHMRTNCGLTERESQARATATTGDHPHHVESLVEPA